MVNFFAALDDSGDESEQQVKKQPEPKQKKDKVKPTKKVAVVAAVAAPVKSQDEPRRQAHHNDRNLKAGRGGGSRSERQPPRDGKRAYERRSGTGRGHEIKKSGGGSRNWGSDKNEARHAEGMIFDEKENGANLKNISSEAAEPTAGQSGGDGDDAAAPEAKENGDAVAVDPPKEEEEEDKTMTYEEYLVQKDEQQAESEAFQPIEMRELENEFSGLVGKKGRKEVEAEMFLKMGKDKQLKKKGTEKKEKEKIVPKFRVQDANAPPRRRNSDRRDGDRPQGGGGRGYDRRGGGDDANAPRRSGGNRRDGDRPQGRGGGGRGSDRRGGGERKSTRQVDVADMSSFPSL